MIKLAFLFLALCSALAEEAPKSDVQLEDGVLVLTSKNFDDAVKNHPFILVEFYAPWCGHCKNLAPEYAKAAQKLAAEGSSIKLAKVDCTVESDLGTRFEVRGYPTLKLFREGSPTEYTGGRTEETIVNWLKKKSGPAAAALQSKEDVEKLLSNNVAVVGYFKDVESGFAKAFLKVAGGNDEFPFGISSDEELMRQFNIENEGIVLFKNFDEKRADLTGEMTVESISSFIDTKSTPLLPEFNQQSAGKLFAKKETPFLFLAAGKSAEGFEAVSEAFTKLAKENQGKIQMVLLNTDTNAAAQVINYLSVESSDIPTYRMLNLEKNLKYKPESSDLSYEKVASFISAYLNGELKPYLKSEEVPSDWDSGNVKVLVGKNFKQVAFDETKHVFVEFYAPWCGHCKNLAPIWEQLGEKFAGSKDVIIAKMDYTQNEVEDVTIRGFPTLKMFPAGSNAQVDDYSGDRSLDDLVKFVSKYSPLPQKDEQPQVESPEAVSEDESTEKKKDEL